MRLTKIMCTPIVTKNTLTHLEQAMKELTINEKSQLGPGEEIFDQMKALKKEQYLKNGPIIKER